MLVFVQSFRTFVVVILCWVYNVVSSVSSTNKTDGHDITEILLKVVLNTMTLALTLFVQSD